MGLLVKMIVPLYIRFVDLGLVEEEKQNLVQLWKMSVNEGKKIICMHVFMYPSSFPHDISHYCILLEGIYTVE